MRDQPPVAAEDSERNLQRYLADGFRGWQARLHIVISADDARCQHRRAGGQQAGGQYHPAPVTATQTGCAVLALVVGSGHRLKRFG